MHCFATLTVSLYLILFACATSAQANQVTPSTEETLVFINQRTIPKPSRLDYGDLIEQSWALEGTDVFKKSVHRIYTTRASGKTVKIDHFYTYKVHFEDIEKILIKGEFKKHEDRMDPVILLVCKESSQCVKWRDAYIEKHDNKHWGDGVYTKDIESLRIDHDQLGKTSISKTNLYKIKNAFMHLFNEAGHEILFEDKFFINDGLFSGTE